MKENLLQGFGIRLKQIIENESPYDQSQIARRIEVSPSTMTAWIKEEYYPNSIQLVKLARILKKSTDYLLFGIESTHPDVYELDRIVERLTTKIRDSDNTVDAELKEFAEQLKEVKKKRPSSFGILIKIIKEVITKDVSNSEMAKLVGQFLNSLYE